MGSKQRALEAETLLLGLTSRNADSPVALIGPWLIKEIMEMRSEPVYCPSCYRQVWADPDDIMIIHRGNDLPAVVWLDKDGKAYIKEWWRDGETYRKERLPTFERSDGFMSWVGKHGKYHREGDLPAVINEKGTKFWYIDGEKHRNGDQPATVRANGDKYWYQNGILHRDGDKPAVEEADGYRAWFRDGKLHRDPKLGPAVINPSMEVKEEWWVDGKKQ